MPDNGILAALSAFLLYLATVLIGLRRLRSMEPAILAVGASFIVCSVGFLGMVALAVHFNFWTFLIAYWFLVVSFLMAFGAVYKSLSLRILMDLEARPGRCDNYDELFSRYLVQDSYQNRLSVIRDKALVSVQHELYQLTPRGRRLAEKVRRIQLLFGITRSG